MYNINSVKPLICWEHGQGFLVKMRFGSNNALYSARLRFMFIFLLTPFNTGNRCSLNQMSSWCCLLKCLLQKQCNVVFKSTKREKRFLMSLFLFLS